MTVSRMTPIPMIIDTDLGTDVDDCLALALALYSPEIELVGITCVYGDVDLRARMVHRLLELHGSAGRVPVLPGAREPLLRLRPVFWAGHEGRGLLTAATRGGPLPSAPHAAEFIIETVLDNPGEIHLVAIGPLTNLAQALLREPRVATEVGHVTLMGGAIRGPDALQLPYAEHNIRSDPEAAHIVFASGAPITMVPLDVTTAVRLTPAGAARIRARGTPFHEAIAAQVEAYPRFRDRGFTYLHDPLALAAVLRPHLLRLMPVHVDVELDSRYAAGATLVRQPDGDARVHAAVEVRSDEFVEFFLSRVGG
jgi:purine nucleosidase